MKLITEIVYITSYLIPIIPFLWAFYTKESSYFTILFTCFICIESLMIFTNLSVTFGVLLFGGYRCQKYKNWARVRTIANEFFESSRCMLCVSQMASFPIYSYYKNEPTALTFSIEEATKNICYMCENNLIRYVVYILLVFVGIVLADIWLYIKHRLLHYFRNTLYLFHRHHHSFKDPTAFAGFAVHPLEAWWTFFPIGLWYYFPHYIPIFSTVVVLFFFLNAYLHCGYVLPILEAILPHVFLNTSAFHNRHHELCSTHFGEIGTIMDYLFGTAPEVHGLGIKESLLWYKLRITLLKNI